MHRPGACPPRSRRGRRGPAPAGGYATISAVISSARPPATAAADVEPVIPAPAPPKWPSRVWGPRRSDRIWSVLAGLVVLAGIGAQLRVWASDRGFWGDELYIA